MIQDAIADGEVEISTQGIPTTGFPFTHLRTTAKVHRFWEYRTKIRDAKDIASLNDITNDIDISSEISEDMKENLRSQIKKKVNKIGREQR